MARQTLGLLLYTALAFNLGNSSAWSEEQRPANFRTENLVAWCIVPFDAKKRSPKQRAEMLVDLNLRRCAYDWREKHVPEFEQEILQYKKHDIEFFAFWGAHDSAFALFEKYNLRPQIWITLGSPNADNQRQRVAAAAASLEDLAVRTKKLGCKLGLYNHGGWGGEPENLVAVCQALKKRGHDHVGIVYNFHHGHGHIDDFEQSLKKMLPWLHCLNLNGMADASAVDGNKNKILPIGGGKHEAAMIQLVIESGYSGPIGILDHISSQDAALSLQNNIKGLETLIGKRDGDQAAVAFGKHRPHAPPVTVLP